MDKRSNPIESDGSEETIQDTPQKSSEVIQPIEVVSTKKSPTKKFVVILLCIFVIIFLAAGAVYFLVSANKSLVGTPPETSVKPQGQEGIDTKLSMQLNSSIALYDVENAESKVVTKDVPEGYTVLSFYYDSDSDWRYYATDALSTNIYYADQSTVPFKVQGIERPNDAYTRNIVANAQHRIYAYALSSTGDLKTETYMVNNNDSSRSELVYESETRDSEVSLKSYLYVVSDISKSGNNLLFQKEVCFQCGGGALGKIFSLSLEDDQTTILQDEEIASRGARFMDDDRVLVSQGSFSFPWQSNGQANVTSYILEPTKKTQVFNIGNGSAESYSIDKTATYSLTRRMNASEDNYLPGYLYKIENSKSTALAADLGLYDTEAPYQYALGTSAGDCVSSSFYSRDVVNTSADYSTGVICKQTDNSYKYQSILDLHSDSSYNIDAILTLL
jgi:hypothetical protein